MSQIDNVPELGHLLVVDHTRTKKGPHFVEGSRLLWVRLEQRGLTAWTLAKDSGLSRSSVHRWMYGDKVPDMADAETLRKRLGIPLSAWVKKARPFELPAARKAA